MAEEIPIARLRDDFYRDSFNKVLAIIIAFCCGILMMVGMSLYLHFTKPPADYIFRW